MNLPDSLLDSLKSFVFIPVDDCSLEIKKDFPVCGLLFTTNQPILPKYIYLEMDELYNSDKVRTVYWQGARSLSIIRTVSNFYNKRNRKGVWSWLYRLKMSNERLKLAFIPYQCYLILSKKSIVINKSGRYRFRPGGINDGRIKEFIFYDSKYTTSTGKW